MTEIDIKADIWPGDGDTILMMFRSTGVFRATRFLFKRVPFKLADIGEGISEVQIIQWHVKEGSPIKQFEKIAEVQSDKATVEITSRYDGIVKKLYYKANDMAKVGETLIDIETEDGSKEGELGEKSQIEATKQKEQDSIVHECPKTNANTHPNDLVMLPSVRKFVKENNINLCELNLTGRITKEDITAALSKTISPGFKEQPMNPVQKAMARAMEESLKIPHFGYSDEFQMDNLIKVRQEYNEKSSVKISIMPFIIKAICSAIKDFPTINSHFLNGKLMCSSIINLGIAVDTPQGLVVPVLKNITEDSIEEISKKLTDVTDRSRRNKLNKEDFEDATLTVSNIGTIGGTYANPVIVPPQVCIVAIGKIRTMPVYTEMGGIEPQKLACFSWSADHRAIDGATMARFSNRVKELIEK